MKSLDLNALLSRLALLALFAPMFQLVGAAQVSFPSDPLATRTTGSAKPNLMFILDDSGSMGNDYLPDEANDCTQCGRNQINYGYYSAQCNGVAYDPTQTYTPPVKSDGTSYGNISFASAPSNGIAGGNGTNLGGSVYYTYHGTQPKMSYAWTGTSVVKGTFYNECASPVGATPGSNVFTAVTMTSASSDAQNYANWHSYYRTRMLMMKSTVSQAFKNVDNRFRVGFTTISETGATNTPTTFLNIKDFDTNTTTGLSDDTANCAGLSQKTCWYKKFLAAPTVSSTPLRGALSKVGQIYAGKRGNYLSAIYDPVQYSCQQNFTILATDGYWNTGNEDPAGTDFAANPTPCNYGPCNLNNPPHAVGNQDGDQPRPYWDGATSTMTTTKTWSSRATTQTTVVTPQTVVSTAIAATTTLTPVNGWSRNVYSFNNHLISISSVGRPSSGCGTCTVTITTNGPHGFTSGQSVVISGVTVTGTGTNNYNGTFVITVTGATTFTYVVAARGPSGPSGGTASLTTSSCPAGQGNLVTQVQHQDESTSSITTNTTTTTTTGGNSTTVTTSVASTPYTEVIIVTNGVQTSDVTTPGTTSTASTPVTTVTAGTNVSTISSSSTVANANVLGAWTNFGAATTGSCTTTLPNPSTSASVQLAGPSTTTPTISVVNSTTGPTTTNGTSSTTVSGPTTTTTTPQSSSTSSSSGGTSNTLADVAMYYYKGPLRSTALNNCTAASTGANLCPALPNVPTTLADGNNQQHMNTFTIALGIDGILNYDANYLNEVASSNPNDYYNIAHGSVNWPDPTCVPSPSQNCNTVIERIDDLWHAAVNGHGQYFSAKNPAQVVSSLNAALQGITARLGYGSGAATSNLVPVQGDNFLFTASYTTKYWTGNVRALTIAVSGTAAGSVSNAATWCSEDVAADPVAGIPACVGSMRSMVGATTDKRTIKYFKAGTTNNVLDFNDTNLAASGYLNWFNPGGLSQYASGMIPGSGSASATNLVNYLRGQNGNEANGGTTNTVQLYRPRTTVLGDIVDSQPVYVRKPIYSYLDPGYSAFVTAKSNRAATVFVGANDGMLHAIDASVDPTTFAATATSGQERWAFIPTPAMQNMSVLADYNYPSLHHFYVDGSPVQFDVCVANCTNPATADWRTILVEGLDDGGRGYVALDVTDPTVPKALWEFTSSNDADLGYAFGRPMSVKLQTNTAYGTQWVILVASGYDNGTNDANGALYPAAQQGSGHGFLYALDPITGAVISKIDTGAGSATAPSGLSQINAWSADPAHDATALYVYGGDLSGNVWRFDLNNGTAAVGKGTAMLMTTLHDDTGATQPITTAPELANVSGQRVVYIGTGKYLEASDVTNTQQQSLYALKDDGTTFTLPPTRSTVVTGVAPMIKQTLVDTVLNGQTVRTVTMNSTPVDFATQRGWYADFPDVGERENIDMQLLLGTLVVPTNIPKTDVCTAGGSSWLNYLDYKTGGFVTTSNNTNQIVGQYYPADMTTGLSVVWINGTPTGIRTGTGSLPAQTSGYYNSSSPPGVIGHRVSWREVIQQQ